MWRPVTRSLSGLLCLACLCAATGCSLFRSNVDVIATDVPRHLPEITAPNASQKQTAQNQKPAADADSSSVQADSKPASCYVEIRALGEKPKKIRMSVDDATHVQAVLEKTGLVKDFKNMNIHLSRKLPNGSRHKMDVRYDPKQDHVISAFDYALHPNDLLVVQEDSATSFDTMLKKLAGPLAR